MSKLNGTPVDLSMPITCQVTYTDTDLVVAEFIRGEETLLFVNLSRAQAMQWGDALRYAATAWWTPAEETQ